MKNLILIIFTAAAFAACKSKPDYTSENRNIRLIQDSGAYANSALSDTTPVAKAAPAPVEVAQPPRTIVKTIVIREKAPQQVAAPVQTSQAQQQAPESVPPVVATTPSVPTAGQDDPISSGGSETASAPEKAKVKKPGMNKATEGAIIGGVAGAVGGAIVSKKKGVGAVVGAVAGAAGGYIIGKKLDKKSNQYAIE